ncbi:hypothetical protein D3C87_183220 [compost metagenome]
MSEMNKLLLLESLDQLLSYNVIGNLQYKNRYVGFSGELSFIQWYSINKPQHHIFDGGYFVPITEKKTCFEDSIYFTVSADNFDQYLPIYRYISKLRLKKYYFIQYDSLTPLNLWKEEDLIGTGRKLLVPDFKVMEFIPDRNEFIEVSLGDFISSYEKKENYNPSNKVPESLRKEWLMKLEKFDESLIKQLYVQRLIFDGFLGFKIKRGIPSDIDCIIMNDEGKLIFIEVKEKDLSKGKVKGFGMDIHRIDALAQLSTTTKLNVAYVVRHVRDQIRREFIEWLSISILDFKEKMDKNAIEGGTGMRSIHSSNPTYICDKRYFTILK